MKTGLPSAARSGSPGRDVRPDALDGLGAVAHHQVEHPARTRREVGAQVGHLLALGVDPTGHRIRLGELVRDRLGVLVAGGLGGPVQGPRGVEVARAALVAGVGHVGQVGECHDRSRHRTAPVDRRVVGVVVVGAVARPLVVPAVRIRSGGRHDHVLGVAVGRLGGVAEVGGGGRRLGGQLMTRGIGGRLGRVVVPDAGQHATGRIRDLRIALLAPGGADRGTVAVLGHGPAPLFPSGADPGVEGLEGGGQGVGVVLEGDQAGRGGRLGAPLAAQEHEVDLGVAGGHPGGDQVAGRQAAAVVDVQLGGLAGLRLAAAGRLVAEHVHARRILHAARHRPVAEAVAQGGGDGQDQPRSVGGRSDGRRRRRCRRGSSGGAGPLEPGGQGQTDEEAGATHRRGPASDAPAGGAESVTTGHGYPRYSAPPTWPAVRSIDPGRPQVHAAPARRPLRTAAFPG